MKRIFVCAGMNLAKDDNINEQATKLGYLLAKRGVEYVQGGSAQGLMGLTLNAFLEKSKNVSFFIPKAYYDYDAPLLKELVGAKYFRAKKVLSEADRLKNIIQCDDIIVMPGGTGTLEELLYCNETVRAGEHVSRIFIVNIDGFFDGFLSQLYRNLQEGMSKKSAFKFKVLTSIDQLRL